MSAFDSGWQFFVDPFTTQTFYWEPVNGVYSPWTPLNPSNYHPLRPEAHNVRKFISLLVRSAHLAPLLQVPTFLPDNLGSVSIDPIPAITSHMYAESNSQPPPPTQASQPPPLTQASQVPSLNETTPVLPNPAQAGRNLRCSQRLTRSHDPVRGQRTSRLNDGGRGRTRGSPNYKFREVEVLLDLIEEELPIASKGWRVVGARFRDWAIVTDHPARTDRSLELKFKQVSFPFVSRMRCGYSQHSHSS